MRIPRIYSTTHLQANTSVSLDEQTSHYLGKVLRMQAGRELIVFDGRGGEYPATIESISKKSVVINTGAHNPTDNQSPLHTHLAIGISRGERWDFVLQKATELGVSEITPLFTERCEVKLSGDRLEKKLGHWQSILVSAAEQCQRNILPIINNPQNYSAFISTEPAGLGLVLHHRSDCKITDYTTPKSCTLLVGPEGGLNDDEIDQALNAGYHALTLGPRVLRTETAPLAALSVVQTLWGDF